MQVFFRIVTVPAMILIFTSLYWFHIGDAPAVARRVPSGVIVFVLVMTAIVLIRDFREEKRKEATAPGGSGPNSAQMFKQWVHDWRQQIIFIGLSIGYFVAFITIGFNLANFLFLIIALPVAGMGQNRSLASATTKIVVTASLVTLVFFILATLMDFNVPIGVFGI